MWVKWCGEVRGVGHAVWRGQRCGSVLTQTTRIPVWVKWCGEVRGVGQVVWVCPDPEDEREEPGVDQVVRCGRVRGVGLS